MNRKEIRRLSEDERQAALDLAWIVFSEYESPDYSEEGTEEFRKCLHDEEYLHGIDYYGVFDGQYHRQGVGTMLFNYLLENYKGNIMTVNSSPFGVGFYKSLGFTPTEEEKIINGIRFTPMIYER